MRLVRAPRPGRPVTIVASILLVASLMAGCMDQDGPEPVDDLDPKVEEKEVSEEGPSEVRRDQPLVFDIDAPSGSVVDIAGVFEAQDTGVAGGFVTGSFVKDVDLRQWVPAGVPVRVEIDVRLDAEEVPLVGPTGRVDPIGNETVWYGKTLRSDDPGHMLLTGVLQRPEEGFVGVRLEAYVPGHEEPPEVRYSGEARFEVMHSKVPAGVPVAFPVQAGDNLTLRSEAQAQVLVFSPQDQVLDRLLVDGELVWTVPPAGEGELVILGVPGSADHRLWRQVPEDEELQPLRALDLQRETGAVREVGSPGETAWSFGLEAAPLRVQLVIVGPDGEAWVCSGALSGRVGSGQGQIIERAVECPSPTNVPFLYEEEWVFASRLGDPALVPGEYEVSVESNLSHGFQAYHTVEWYKR
jgi:hypothetical protein